MERVLQEAYEREKIERLESVLDQFIQHVAKLEDYIDELESRISDLEDDSRHHSRQLQVLQPKVEPKKGRMKKIPTDD